MTEFRHGFRKLLVLVVAVGALGTIGAWTLGPFAVELLYDAELSNRTLAVLALGSACYMLGLAFAQAVIALHGHALVALGWTTGMVVFGLTTWITGAWFDGAEQVFRRVELGLLAGSAAAMVAFAAALVARLRSGAQPDAASVIEAITDQPVES
jgi:hypothetical protein